MEMRTHRHKCADLGTYLDPEMVHIWKQKLHRMRTHRHDCADFGTYLDPTPQVCNSKISQSSKKLLIEQKHSPP